MKRAIVALGLVLAASCDDRGSGLTGVTPGLPADRLVLQSQPASAQAGFNISPALQVSVRNADGQTITTSTASISVTITSGTGTTGAVLNGTTTQSAINGVAMFNNLSIDRAGSGYTLTFASGTLTPAVTNAFTVAP